MNRSSLTARSKIGMAGLTAAVIVGSLVVSTLTGAETSDASRRKLAIGAAVEFSRDARTLPGRAAKPVPARPTVAPKTTAAPAASTKPAATTGANRPFLGTLVTNGDNAAKESQAGLKVAMLEFQWRYLEPNRGEYNAKYAASMAVLFNKLRNAGMRVTLGLGLHFAPQWALDLADSRMVNQNGQSSSTLDLVFNQQLRELAAGYLGMVDRAVGLENFWGVRVTSGGVSELLYPSTSYWAYSNGAQNGTLKPPSLAANPMPGFKPADTATPAQRETFGRWYVAALADVADWQMTVVRSLGFTGYFQLLTPGQGFRPNQLPPVFKSRLVDGLLGRGAVWHWLYADLKQREHVTVYVTSVADGSARNDGCQSSDPSVPLTASTVYDWSASRWLTRVAAENGFTVAGEVPGYNPNSSTAAHYRDPSANGLLATAMGQATSCGFLGLYWAHDTQVWDGTVSLSQLAKHSTPTAAMPAAAR